IALLTDALTETGQSGEVPASEIVDTVRDNPHMANAFLALHQQLGNSRQLLSLFAESRNAVPTPGSITETDLLASHPSGSARPASITMPHEEVRDYFAKSQNYIGSLDVAAEDLSTRIRMNRGDVRTVIGRRIESAHEVQIVRRVDLPDGIWHRFDPSTGRLELSAQLNRGQQAFRIAAELAFLEHRDLLDQLVQDAPFSSPAARSLAIRGLANYFAAAVLMPYGRFLESAEDFRYDIERLATFYGTGFESVCHRLSTLQRPGATGIPFSFVRVDRAGNMSKRQSASGFHFATSGGTCPLWNVYESFTSPGQINRQVAQMPDERLYLWIARTVSTRSVRFGQARKTFAIGLGCEARHAHRTVYSQGLDLSDSEAATPIGIGCRLCERPNCPQRAFPPISSELQVDEHRSALSPYLLDGSH
ncbi:short-chain fatty acyl-CoA regulator family protein, partial [Dietzia sp.]|uniref:short-chain fatty acyl-CoA regulator family protein n=1 Tax=Dietzia sp. TaxID=1871616 RepID=UPI002FDB8D91